MAHGDDTRAMQIQLLLWGPIVTCLRTAFRYQWDRKHPDLPWKDGGASGNLLVHGEYTASSSLSGTVSITKIKHDKKNEKTTAAICISGCTTSGIVAGSCLRVHAPSATFDATVTKALGTSGEEFEVELHGAALPTADEPAATAEMLACRYGLRLSAL